MLEPLTLQHISRLVCVQNLLNLTEGKDVTNYLRSAYHSAVTEDLLNHMVQFYPKKLTDDILAGLASPHIHNLKLVNCSQIKPSNFIKISPYCKNLRGLDLRNCSQVMLPDFFVLIDMSGFNLTSVSVEDCTTVDNAVVHSILRNLHHLRHLNVSSCKNITDNAFLLNLDQHLRREEYGLADSYECSLTSIDVSGCHGLTNMAVRNLVTMTGPTLQHVSMSWTNLTLESLLCLSGFHVPRRFLGCEMEHDDEVCEMEDDSEEMEDDGEMCCKTTTCDSQSEPRERTLAMSAEEEDSVQQMSPNISQSTETSAGFLDRQGSTAIDNLDKSCLGNDLSQCVKPMEEIEDNVDSRLNLENPDVYKPKHQQHTAFPPQTKDLIDSGENVQLVNNVPSESLIRNQAHMQCGISHDFKDLEHVCLTSFNELTSYQGHVRCWDEAPTEMCFIDSTQIHSDKDLQSVIDPDIDDIHSSAEMHVNDGNGISKHRDFLNGDPLSNKGGNSCIDDDEKLDKCVPLFSSCAKRNAKIVSCSVEMSTDTANPMENAEFLDHAGNQDGPIRHAFNHTSSKTLSNSMSESTTILNTGSESTSESTALLTTGSESTSESTALLTTGSESTSESTALLTTGSESTSESTALLTTGSESTSENTALLTTGSESTSESTALLTTGSESTSESTALITTGSESTGAKESFPLLSKSNTSALSDVKLNSCTALTNADDWDAVGRCSGYPEPPTKESFISLVEQPPKAHSKSFASSQGENELEKCLSVNNLIHCCSNRSFDEDMLPKNSEGSVVLSCDVSQIILQDDPRSDDKHTINDFQSSDGKDFDCNRDERLSPAAILPKLENLTTASVLPKDAINQNFESLAGVDVPVVYSCSVLCESGYQKSGDSGVEGSTPTETDDQRCMSANSGEVDFSQPRQTQSTNESSISLKNLQLTDLRNHTKSTQGKRKRVDQILPSLKHIYKPNIKSIDLEEIDHPNNKQQDLENAFSVFITRNSGLQSLKLSWIKFPNHLLKLVVDTCVDLREITLIGCNVIDPEHVRCIGSQCKNLRKVELEDLRRMTDWSVVPIVSKSDIETLSLSESDIHDVTAIRLAAKLSENLRSLNISYCQELTERGINAFLRKQSCMESFSARQGALTNLSLGLLSSNFRMLRVLNIASVEAISGSGLVSMMKSLHYLEFIDLSWAGGSSLLDEVTEAILKYCPRINRMVLDGQALLTSKPFLPIISDCEKWNRCKALFVFKAKERAAKAVMCIEDEAESSDGEYEELYFPHRSTHFATNLQSLCLEYCDSITDTDMEDIVTVCRGSITVIDYYSCQVQPKLLKLGRYKVKDLSGIDVPR
ncbi:uncharacterized protein LOC125662696 [Ostrea edulis]|uniref:uncharacterized protein LOC125662696 n=1 Tax=Ostrea edulis TaxID=37623 RepID=UPI0024AE9F5E|nr:uncharacterized protein LOC125662696 [Ostrea edulis]